MIYLLINDGKDDATMIPVSAVTSIRRARIVDASTREEHTGEIEVTTVNGGNMVTDSDTINVITTDDSEAYVAQKIYENFIQRKV